MKLLYIILSLIIPVFLRGQDRNDIQYLKNTIEQLTKHETKGRQTGSHGELISGSYVINELKNLGIEPYANDYLQEFSFDFVNKRSDSTKSYRLNGTNIVGLIDNSKSKTIVLGAHYDHLGVNEFGQGRSVNSNGAFFPGADDNASGVALLLSLTKWLNTNKNRLNVNYIIAFFSAEELGLHGSKHFVNQLSEHDNSVFAMVNFDMVGRLNADKKIIVDGIATAHSFDSLIGIVENNYDFNLEKNKSGVGSSDYTSFYLDSIPALSFTTGVHSDYHTVQDTKDKINYVGITEIKAFIIEFLMHLESSEAYFKATKVKKAKSRSKLKVSLGIMPSYSGADGLKIDAVTTGKTAALFGVIKNDIIIGIDECEITSIYDYMDCLAKYDIGDQAILHILRNNQEKELKIEFK